MMKQNNQVQFVCVCAHHPRSYLLNNEGKSSSFLIVGKEQSKVNRLRVEGIDTKETDVKWKQLSLSLELWIHD